MSLRTKSRAMMPLCAGLLASLFLTAASAGTNTLLEASHHVLSSADDGSGLSAITLEVTLYNPSAVDLTNVSLELMPERTLIIVDSPRLTVDSLAAGATTTVDWTIHSPIPADLLDSGIPMMLAGDATDGLGESVAVSAISH
jgi:hypothetical protein